MYGLLAIVIWIVGGCLSVYIGINNILIGVGTILIVLVLGSLCWAVEEIICSLRQIIHNQLIVSKDYGKMQGQNIPVVRKSGDWYCEQCKMHNKEARITCSNCGSYRK
ncbi:MAG: zinc finger Ran-binding domain-containing family 2 protein [Clostridiales bacterium]|jgi:hypothetical protein|nr:zinc finger Ran-binding domain-containing family 2 protein [Clostridiales bacterium]